MHVLHSMGSNAQVVSSRGCDQCHHTSEAPHQCSKHTACYISLDPYGLSLSGVSRTTLPRALHLPLNGQNGPPGSWWWWHHQLFPGATVCVWHHKHPFWWVGGPAGRVGALGKDTHWGLMLLEPGLSKAQPYAWLLPLLSMGFTPIDKMWIGLHS